MTLDLLSIEIFQLELDRRLSSGNSDPLFETILQASVSKLLKYVDDLQSRCANAAPDAFAEDITMLRTCIDLMKSLGNPHPRHLFSTN